jgi:hypothetical protein
MGNSFHKTSVIPAKAGIHFPTVKSQWIPAFAGMTIGDPLVTHFPNTQKRHRIPAFAGMI